MLSVLEDMNLERDLGLAERFHEHKAVLYRHCVVGRVD
jgi:hypothetical protein